MKLVPLFYGVEAPEEIATLRRGLERISALLDVECHKFSGVMSVDVWSTQTGARVYPKARLEGFILNPTLDRPDKSEKPIGIFFPKNGGYVRINIGQLSENNRLNAFNIYYQPLETGELLSLYQEIFKERYEERRAQK